MNRISHLFIAILLSIFSTANGQTQIDFWHSYEGFIFDKFKEIVDDFNNQSTEYHVNLQYKGNFTETYNAGIEAFSTNSQPHILYVYEVATQTMMLQPELFISADNLMKQHLKMYDPEIYIDAVRDFYSAENGKLYSLPWSASTGILYYNKAVFEKAGLDPENPPTTWFELEKVGKKLVDAGFKGFVTAWPAAYHIEHQTALHSLSFATHENGYGGLASRLNFNSPVIVRHVQKLVEWQQNGIFSYQGRFTNEPEQFFASGKCGILLQGANRFSILKRMCKDPIGVGFLPYWSDVVDSPFRLNIGGGSFWALSGFDENIYRGIALFFSFLSQPETQCYWHEQTGYLPITEAAYYLSKKKGFYEKNPAAEIAVLEVLHRKGTDFTKGVRLGNYLVIRELIIDCIEKALKREVSTKEALDQAVIEGNKILEAYENENSSA